MIVTDNEETVESTGPATTRELPCLITVSNIYHIRASCTQPVSCFVPGLQHISVNIDRQDSDRTWAGEINNNRNMNLDIIAASI